MNGIFRQSALWRKREIKTNVSFMARKLKKRYSYKKSIESVRAGKAKQQSPSVSFSVRNVSYIVVTSRFVEIRPKGKEMQNGSTSRTFSYCVLYMCYMSYVCTVHWKDVFQIVKRVLMQVMHDMKWRLK